MPGNATPLTAIAAGRATSEFGSSYRPTEVLTLILSTAGRYSLLLGASDADKASAPLTDPESQNFSRSVTYILGIRLVTVMPTL